MRKRKKRLKIGRLLSLLIFVILIGISVYFYFNTIKIKSIEVTEGEENKIIVNASILSKKKDVYCYLSETKDLEKDEEIPWELMKDNKCKFETENGEYYVLLKYKDKIIDTEKVTVDVHKLLDLKVDKEKIYLAIDGKTDIKTELVMIGSIEDEVSYVIEDESIATYSDGQITGVSEGETKLTVSVKDIKKEIPIIVTSLIKPIEIDNLREAVGCKEFSVEEENLLNEILEARVNEAGYATRGGVVAAARFITMEFSRRVVYFPENGRVGSFGVYLHVDGEGRYYHKGLYLTEANYDKLDETLYGPAPWGCNLYTYLYDRYRPNGLDCSGFISWILLNGGFDVGDVGAGPTDGLTDLTDYGDKQDLGYDNVDDIKVGDLLNSYYGDGETHIAMVIGYDGTHYYVAESLWYNPAPYYGGVVMKYTKSELIDHFMYVMFMDSYYKEEGNYENMWY